MYLQRNFDNGKVSDNNFKIIQYSHRFVVKFFKSLSLTFVYTIIKIRKKRSKKVHIQNPEF